MSVARISGPVIVGIATASCSTEPASFPTGQWTMTTEVGPVTARVPPGHPHEADARRLLQTAALSRGKTVSIDRCVNAQDTANLIALFVPNTIGSPCAIKSSDTANGRLTIEATCRPRNRSPVDLKLDGRYAANRYNIAAIATSGMNVEVNGERLRVAQPIMTTVRTRFYGKRTGGCRQPKPSGA